MMATRFYFLIGVLLLSACSIAPQTPEPLLESDNSAIQNWQLQGKIGLRGADFAESAYIRWQQCQSQFDIQLNGPLGSGAVKLTGTPQQTTIKTTDETLTTDAPELLLFERFGWHLPIKPMLFWLRGVPAPDPYSLIAYSSIDRGFIQHGWQITYTRYQAVDNYRLPAKLIAENPQLKITLIIKDWQLQPACR